MGTGLQSALLLPGSPLANGQDSIS